MARIILDLDDVLIRFVDSVVFHINKRYGFGLEKKDIRGWNISDYVPLTTLEIFEPISTKSFWDTVKPISGAIRFVCNLLDAGYDARIVTASWPDGLEYKAQLINKLFPEIGWDKTIVAKDKSVICCDVIVDDAVHNLVNHPEKLKLLYTQPWNEDYDAEGSGIVRIHNYDEIFKKIKAMETMNDLK